jgi:S1-C subfamily serine protease
MRPGEEDGTRGLHALWLADVAPAALARALDVRAMPRDAEDARRLPWLGVECEPLRGPLVAAALGVADATRDGARGLVVNRVYPGSPAARAGIRVDDVLLWARRTDAAGDPAPPVDLVDAPGSLAWTDDAEVPRPWRPRGDAVVRLLSAWDVGTPYEVGYARGGEAHVAKAVVETGPRDVSSALRARDEGTGLLVKELTYEVRAGLRLEGDAPGVLVADVVEGSSAARARVSPYEVVREVDGVPADDPKVFAERLAAARAAGKDAVRLVVLRLDRSRFVDLRLEGEGGPNHPEPPPGEPGK